MYVHPNFLFISWEKNKNKRTYKNIKRIEDKKNTFKKIDDYNPTGNLIYNDNILLNINKNFS